MLSVMFPAIIACACGGSGPAPLAAAAVLPKTPPLLPLSEMRYVASEPHKSAITIVVVVHADGRLERPGKQTARIVDGRLVCADGSTLLSVDEASALMVDGHVVAHLTGDGSFSMEPDWGDWGLRVLDDGAISLTTHAEGTTSTHDLRWEGFHPEARRTASLLSALFTPAFGGRWCGEKYGLAR